MIEVTLSEMQQINIELSETELQVELGSELVIANDFKDYTGPFSITPSTALQILSTAERYIGEDIEIKGIPYSEQSNGAGGKTAVIG